LNESNALSHDLLTHRYESLPVCFLQNEVLVPNVKTSLWWRDVMMIGGVSDACLFSHNVNNILGDGFKGKMARLGPLRGRFSVVIC
jgi:hypothetical protein